MADDGLLHLREFGSNDFIAPKEWQGGRVVAEQEDALFGAQRDKCGTDFGEVLVAELFPFRLFSVQHVRAEHGECDESGNAIHQKTN